jgi:hypothetical protein
MPFPILFYSAATAVIFMTQQQKKKIEIHISIIILTAVMICRAHVVAKKKIYIKLK